MRRARGRLDSFRFVVCARGDCRQVFFLCRHCDRGDRYCSPACAQRARRATLRDAGRRYQHSRPGRFGHAARQAQYRARRSLRAETVTHQTSQRASPHGIVPTSPPSATPIPSDDEEEARYAETDPRVPLVTPVRCARCRRRGRFVRHQTLAHVRRGLRR